MGLVLVLAPELVLVQVLVQAPELVLVQARELVLALGRHNQPPNLQLITMPAESTIFSFSLIYLLLRFCNLAVY
jgi:hypothetical protein